MHAGHDQLLVNLGVASAMVALTVLTHFWGLLACLG
jgi:light-regulated signal transduction histidine kinase (bacteriophytochrome)